MNQILIAPPARLDLDEAASQGTSLLTVQRLDFLPVALALLCQMGVAEGIDAAVGPPKPGPQMAAARAQGQPPPRSGPSVGTWVEAMVLNILEGRVALMNMEQWLRGIEVGALWGPQVDPASFTDDRLARSLDALFAVGLENLYTQIVARVIQRFEVPMGRLHGDGSTVKVYGAYQGRDKEPGPQAARGHSKDRRPDLLQFVLGMTVQEQGLPVASDVLDGNTTDQPIYRMHLERIGPLLADPQQTTFVGDCKVCDAQTLGALRSAGLHVTTLMPKSFSLWEQGVQQALEQPDSWSELDRHPGRTRKDPEVVYRGCLLPIHMRLWKLDDKGHKVQWTEPFQALVVHSSELEKTHAQAHRAQQERERKKLEQQIAQAAQPDYPSEAEAQQQAQRFLKSHQSSFFLLQAKVEPEVKVLRRLRRGRPKQGEAAPQVTVYRVRLSMHLDRQAQQDRERRQGLFVLITSQLAQAGADVLADYRGQKVVEAGFRWLKAPGQIGPVLLHTPTRVAALGMVFTLALLLYRLMQWRLRRELKQTKTTIPGHHGRPTDQPTLELVMKSFSKIDVVFLRRGTGTQRVVTGLRPFHERILALFGLSREIYDGLHPDRKK
jgi:transposase